MEIYEIGGQRRRQLPYNKQPGLLLQSPEVPFQQRDEELYGITVAKRRTDRGQSEGSVHSVLERRTYFSVFNLTMIVSAPKNLTFSSGRPSRWWASDHAWGELCSRDKVDCVLEIVLGEAGSYRERISFVTISSGAFKTSDSKKKRARKTN